MTVLISVLQKQERYETLLNYVTRLIKGFAFRLTS